VGVQVRQAVAGVALVNVADAVWRLDRRGGRWRAAGFDAEPFIESYWDVWRL
jgi:hypothetical protein